MTDFTTPADAALSELGALIGIPALKFDTAGYCQLAFDKHHLVTVICAPAMQRLVLACPLVQADTLLSAAAHDTMLQANFMGCGCAGGSLGIAPDGRPCLQFFLAFAEIDGQTLLSHIDTLLDQAEIWSERIQRSETHPAAGTRPHEWILGKV